MKFKKIIGALGVVLGVAAPVFHAIDVSALPDKWVPVYTTIGTVMALLGYHPLKKE